ncbi:hypothetical protein [Flavonifractor plautii]|nr:hypothetical protein [Flavonifractor plautii]
MARKKYMPPGGAGGEKRRIHWLLHQKPKMYPSKPRSNRNNLIKPIHRA